MRHPRSLLLGLIPAILLPASLAVGGASQGGTPARVAALEREVTILSLTLEDVRLDTLPAGAIVAWSGLPGMLPEGWALCDGVGGTPDLHDKFIMGTARPEEMGTEGGNREHGHVASEHRHPFRLPHHRHEIPASTELTTAEAGEHTHEIGPSTGSGAGIDDPDPHGGLPASAHPHTHDLPAEGLHDHDLVIPARVTRVGEGDSETEPAESTPDRVEHLPPYYRLAFIVKLAEADGPSEPGPSSPPTGNFQQRIEALEETVALLSSTLNAALPNIVPPRLVVMWSGSLDLLPDGWALCDGEDGRPDLREKFVMGAVSSADMGETGGSLEHTHTLRGHQHEITLPLHAHDIPASVVEAEPVGDHIHDVHPTAAVMHVDDWPVDHMASNLGHDHSISAAGAHSHVVEIPEQSTSEAGRSSLTAPPPGPTLERTNHLPPYYRMAFIAKRPRAAGSPEYPNPSSSGGLNDRIAALEEAVAALSSALERALPFFVPPETVAIWTKSADLLPEGWVLCDGENGTPDLRGRFVVGAVVGAGEQGGAETHDHEMDPHVHTAVLPHTHADNPIRARTSTDPSYDTGHFHRSVWSASGSVPTGTKLSGVAVADWLHSHFDPSDPTMIHEHELRLVEAVTPAGNELQAEIAEAASEVTAAENVPPYYKAAFVMKLP